MVLLQRKLYFSKDLGGPTFLGGGVQGPSVYFYRNPYNLWFSGGVRTPYHPLWIRTWSLRRITLPHYMCKLTVRVKWGKFGH